MLSAATRAGDPEAVALVRRSFVEADQRHLRHAVVSISLQREDLASLLPDVTVPTLMITCDQHSGWTPAPAASAATALRDGRVAAERTRRTWCRLSNPTLWSALSATSGHQP